MPEQSLPAAAEDARAAARAVALSAIAREGMSVDAVLTLGVDALAQGNGRKARGYLHYARALTKRNLQVQFWAIEDAVARDDIPRVLREYDIALRTSQNGRDALFPILAQAISDLPVRRGAIDLLDRRPYWAPSFLFFLAREGPSPLATAEVFSELRHRGFPVAEGAVAILIDKLIGAGALEQAWSFYATDHPTARRDRSRDPRFSEERAGRSVFDWQFFGDGSNLASIERGDRGNVLSIAVGEGGGGLLVRQTQLLPPGRYMLRGRGNMPGQSEAMLPYWELRCVDGRNLGRTVLPGSAEAAEFAQSFTVPSDCPVQQLSLVAPPHDQAGAAEGTIDAVQLQPAG
ncbi:hypothetical protein [uncultured Sphingomonas sp.]|uniref:hypothetical protein n=1 Tax=uncultured Sphingomonas sp. TaxID=158754 RepID=UPI002586C4AB|nr:hypothetical protein [uncultured Sphingomonas sp.]